MKLAVITLLLCFCERHLEWHDPGKLLISSNLHVRPGFTFQETSALIQAAAQRHRVPAAFVKSIVAAESNFNAAAVSPKGAIGLMQLMPQTARQYGVDPTDPTANIDGGTRYLHALIQRYQKSRNWLQRAIAAYNAGPGVVDRYHGVPPYKETRTYVTRVLAYFHQFRVQS